MRPPEPLFSTLSREPLHPSPTAGDGGSWSGNRDDPIPSADAEYADPPIPTVIFRGRRNLNAIIDALLTPSYGMAGAEKVLYAGASAGGLTSYLHCENVRGM